MTCDGRDKGRVSLVDKVIHVICPPHGVLHLLHVSFHLIHFPFQVWYLRVIVPLDWSPPLTPFFVPPFLEFFPRSSSRRCWRCLLTSLVNSWFCCVKSATMDCNYCWTIDGGGGARFGWLETFSLSWCSGLVAIDLVQTMHPFCLGKQGG